MAALGEFSYSVRKFQVVLTSFISQSEVCLPRCVGVGFGTEAGSIFNSDQNRGNV